MNRGMYIGVEQLERAMKISEDVHSSELNPEIAFDRIQRKVVEWATRRKGIPEAVMSLYDGVRAKVKVGTHLSEEIDVNVGVHQRSISSPLLFAIVIAVVTKESTLQEILYADDLVLIALIMTELHKKNYCSKSALRTRGLKVNLVKTKVMVSRIGQINIKPSSKKDMWYLWQKNNC